MFAAPLVTVPPTKQGVRRHLVSRFCVHRVAATGVPLPASQRRIIPTTHRGPMAERDRSPGSLRGAARSHRVSTRWGGRTGMVGAAAPWLASS